MQLSMGLSCATDGTHQSYYTGMCRCVAQVRCMYA